MTNNFQSLFDNQTDLLSGGFHYFPLRSIYNFSDFLDLTAFNQDF